MVGRELRSIGTVQAGMILRWPGLLCFVFFLIFLIFPTFGLGSALRGQAPESPGEHTAVLNGARLWYKIGGAPQPGMAPLLYLAGGPGYNSYSFEKTIGRQLERHVQMIYFDERGTGRSERPRSGDYAMATLVEDIEALRKSLGLAHLSVMGHSFGGTIALEYARTYPEHMQKLILSDAGADIPDAFEHWQKEIASRYPAQWKAAMAGADGEALRNGEAQAAAKRNGGACAVTKARFQVEMDALSKTNGSGFHHWQQFRNQRFEREQEALDAQSGLRNSGEMSNLYFSSGSDFLCYRFSAYERLTMPVLVIAGRYDGAIDPEQMRTLAQHLPDARYEEFANSAHFPYAEEPAKFELAVAAFLAVR